MSEEVSVRGIVIRRRDSGESDRRLTLLTEEQGRVEVIAKGARKAASRFAAVSEPLSIGRYTYASGRVRNYLTQALPESSFRSFREDYDRMLLGLALAELFDGATQEGDEQAADAFQVVERILGEVAGHAKPAVAFVWAEAKALDWLGVFPCLHQCVDSGAPIERSDTWLAPSAGGVVSSGSAIEYPDRFRVPYEVLVAMAKIALLEDPPANLIGWVDCITAFDRFWRFHLDRPLPANDALLTEMRIQQVKDRE